MKNRFGHEGYGHTAYFSGVMVEKYINILSGFRVLVGYSWGLLFIGFYS